MDADTMQNADKVWILMWRQHNNRNHNNAPMMAWASATTCICIRCTLLPAASCQPQPSPSAPLLKSPSSSLHSIMGSKCLLHSHRPATSPLLWQYGRWKDCKNGEELQFHLCQVLKTLVTSSNYHFLVLCHCPQRWCQIWYGIGSRRRCRYQHQNSWTPLEIQYMVTLLQQLLLSLLRGMVLFWNPCGSSLSMYEVHYRRLQNE